MSDVVASLRTGSEKTYGTIAIVLGALIWVLFGLGLWAAVKTANSQVLGVLSLYIVYGVLIWFGYLIAGAIYRATAFGNMILLSPNQFPQLYEMVETGAKELGLSPTPATFLYNSNGLFNAFARRLMGGRYVFLTSALVEANDDEQVRFVIGHELGHHAAGHLNPWLNFLKMPAYFVPFLMPAYSRSREYSCDNIGAYLSKDPVASRSALQMLGCGCRRLNGAMSCEAFVAQEAMVPPVAGFVAEIFRSHPRLTRRVAAIRDGVRTRSARGS
ncbi:MAG TPA: M48 family metallopeptidase [Phenylobacterium sp.]|jgi:Zn-dependent protease with chaperone function|nr:M48 family metallopeptidase [Phenylobacterium sp.]